MGKSIHLRKPAKKPFTNIGVFDTETWGLDARPEAFALGICEWVEKGTIYHKVFYDRRDMREFMLSPKFTNYIWYAHNAEYDLLVILGDYINLPDFDKPLYAGSRFISMDYPEYKIKFYDSMNLFPTSLAQIGKQLGFEKMVTPDKFINPGDDRSITSDDVVYCKRDVDILLEAVKGFYELCFNRWGIRTGSTIAKTSLTIFLTEYAYDTEATGHIYVHDNDRYFRNSYYGGRTEVLGGREVVNKCYCYDFNSLYPYCMKTGIFPYPREIIRGLPVVNTILNYEGVSKVKVTVPDCWYPPLPMRDEFGKLIFPTGTFNGWYNHNELRPRIMDNTIRIEKVYASYYSPGKWKPFVRFIDDLYTMRLIAKTNGRDVESLYLKYIMNSLYGKFGQRHAIEHIGTMDEPHDEGWHFKPFSLDSDLGIWKFMDEYMKQVFEDGRQTIISLASYVTSYARIRLYDLVMHIINNGGRVFYTDTDSVFTDMKLNESSGLGGLKLEHFGMFKPIAPKMYEFEELSMEDESTIINRVIKVKGVTRPGALAGDYTMRRVSKLRESHRRSISPGTPITVIKRIMSDDSKRVWLPDGESVPIMANYPTTKLNRNRKIKVRF